MPPAPPPPGAVGGAKPLAAVGTPRAGWASLAALARSLFSRSGRVGEGERREPAGGGEGI